MESRGIGGSETLMRVGCFLAPSYKYGGAAQLLFRLLQNHFAAFHACYEERFAHSYGDWRPVAGSG